MSRSGVLRLLSYNIHGCVNRRGAHDPDGVLDVIREVDADVVALQEVYQGNASSVPFFSGLDELDYGAALFGPTFRRMDADYGNLLLSRLPLEAKEKLDISVGRSEPRGAIAARLQWNRRPVQVIATHLGLRRRERRRQLRRIERWVEERVNGVGEQGCLAFLGDVNEWLPHSRGVRSLQAFFGGSRPLRTYPALFPLFALDRIFVHAPGARAGWRIPDVPGARTASDHLPLVADIAWPAP